jgi:FKBP-type peptidyl-prolyl cis-trans isomerase SlyD
LKIRKDTVVAIEYTIRNDSGDVLDTSSGRAPLEYLHGYRQIVPGVEAAIEGLEAGHELEIHVQPDDAYGMRDEGAILILPRAAFPDGEALEPGTLFRAWSRAGRPIIFSVIEAKDETVVVDANHPLAGQALHVAVLILSVRDATDEERTHGHVHESSPPDNLA